MSHKAIGQFRNLRTKCLICGAFLIFPHSNYCRKCRPHIYKENKKARRKFGKEIVSYDYVNGKWKPVHNDFIGDDGL